MFEMDPRLHEILDLDGGFFVEAGAHDGYSQSNTYSLERIRHWRGLLVEPVPELAREARRERPASRVVQAALVPISYPHAEVVPRYGGLMTIVRGAHGSEAGDRAWVAAAHAVAQEEPEHEFKAPARTLSSLLDEMDAPSVDRSCRWTSRASRQRSSPDSTSCGTRRAMSLPKSARIRSVCGASKPRWARCTGSSSNFRPSIGCACAGLLAHRGHACCGRRLGSVRVLRRGMQGRLRTARICVLSRLDA